MKYIYKVNVNTICLCLNYYYRIIVSALEHTMGIPPYLHLLMITSLLPVCVPHNQTKHSQLTMITSSIHQNL